MILSCYKRPHLGSSSWNFSEVREDQEEPTRERRRNIFIRGMALTGDGWAFAARLRIRSFAPQSHHFRTLPIQCWHCRGGKHHSTGSDEAEQRPLQGPKGPQQDARKEYCRVSSLLQDHRSASTAA